MRFVRVVTRTRSPFHALTAKLNRFIDLVLSGLSVILGSRRPVGRNDLLNNERRTGVCTSNFSGGSSVRESCAFEFDVGR